jgi:hypothetical protein
MVVLAHMFNEEETERLQSALQQLVNPLELTLFKKRESEFGRTLERVVDEIFRLSHGKTRIATGLPEHGLPAWPCFKMGSRGRANIIYAALPTGHEFRPFIRALELMDRDYESAAVEGVGAELQVFISEDCPRCPAAVETAVLLAIRHSWITCCVVNAGQFPETARQYGIRSVPAIVLDRKVVSVGDVSADRLMNLVRIRGTSKFEIEAVRSLVETGRIAEAADSLASEAGRELILNFMQHPDFSKRLSALAVVENALDRNPDTVRAMTPSLLALLSHPDARIRGDVADLLGKTGDPRAIAGIEPLTADPDPDVAEAAADAIADLRKQHS